MRRSVAWMMALFFVLYGCAVSDTGNQVRSPRSTARLRTGASAVVSERHIRNLIANIDHEDISLRQSAIDELVKIGRPAVPILLETLTSDIVGKRAFAALILGQIGDRRAVEPIIWALGTDHWFARRVAVIALGFLADERAIEPMMRMARDPDERVRAEVATSISAFADARAVITIIQLQNDRSEKVRGEANHWAGYGMAYRKFKDRKRSNPAEIPALIRGMSDPLLPVRRFSAEELVNQPDRRAFDALARALADAREDEDVRARSARAIGKIGGRRARPELERALGDKNEVIRAFAVAGLIELGDKRAEDALVGMIHDRDETVRHLTYFALASLGGPRAYEVLVGEMQRGIPLAALRLGNLGDRRAVEPLLEYVSHPDPEFRGRVLMALGFIGDARAVPALLAAVNDESETIRNLVGDALGTIDLTADLEPIRSAVRRGDERMIESLFANADSNGLGHVLGIYDLLEHENKRLRLGAATALAKSGAFDLLDPPPVPKAAKMALQNGVSRIESASVGDHLRDGGDHFFEAVSLAPWWADAHFNLALWAESGRLWDLALRHLDLYLALAPYAVDVRKVRARISALEQQRGEKPKIPGL